MLSDYDKREILNTLDMQNQELANLQDDIYHNLEDVNRVTSNALGEIMLKIRDVFHRFQTVWQIEGFGEYPELGEDGDERQGDVVIRWVDEDNG